jgi:carbamoyl-phosphate synthase large subunit
MKSVGEVMSIGRTFKESLQKALCSLETDLMGLDYIDADLDLIRKELRRPNSDRILYIAQAFREGMSVDEIFECCKVDQWYLYQIEEIVEFEKSVDRELLKDKERLRVAKTFGFSDKMLAFLIGCDEEDIYKARKELNVNIEYNEVDTCAAEFKALTPYLYSTTPVSAIEKEENVMKETKVMVIGGGPNRIGQGIEFDYCCVHAAFALNDMGIKSIMYNCNPETVSTDYDTSDILYFEPINFEGVRTVIERENPDGVIVHFGGQTPLKLSRDLTRIGAKIIGTSAEVIDLAEDREKFSEFIQKIGVKQPANATATNKEDALKIAQEIGYPVLVRPSYVLGGRAMRIVYSDDELNQYMEEAVSVSNDSPVLLDKFLDHAIEIDVDAICDGKDVYIGAIMQHIEEAGIHSGDSACSLPPISLSEILQKEIEIKTKEIALGLGVKGLLNIQYAVYQDEIYMIEVNPRASRTVPFVSKATGVPLAKVATRVMYQGDLVEALSFYDTFKVVYKDGEVYKPRIKEHVSVKEAVFPFKKLAGADLILGPEMKSTGEVMGISESFALSFAKSQCASDNRLPKEGTVFISLTDTDKKFIKELGEKFINIGFSIVATGGTHKALEEVGIPSSKVLKISEGRPNIADMIKNEEIALVINSSDSTATKNDARLIRQSVLRLGIPYVTTVAAALVTADAIAAVRIKGGSLNPEAIQDYLS